MVGLPARGKSFICHKLQSFLSWSGQNTEIFNAGQKRRGTDSKQSRSSASFFDSSNSEAAAAREQIAMETLDELLDWLRDGGEIAIFDATNSDRRRRREVVRRAESAAERMCVSVSVVFIESVCDEAAVLEANMLAKVRASPDFHHLSEAAALADLKQRIANYEAKYETLSDEEGAYVKLHNLSSKVTAHQVYGRMSRSLLPFVMSLHVCYRPVMLCAMLPGSDAGALDQAFAGKIARWLREAKAGTTSLRLLSSTQPAAIGAASILSKETGAAVAHQSGLNPLDRGLTAAEGLAALAQMRFNQRFDGGESFQDLVRRLEPCLLDIEASMEPVLVLAHGSPCRALRAYFLGCPVEECMGAASSDAAKALANETHAVVELTPRVGGGWNEIIHTL
eukprot:3893188-Prymnesium_polylepis.1